ncbi:MAG: LPS export ABC transporter periplasmic protein LptC [candidate division FCPU426 bacterium]
MATWRSLILGACLALAGCEGPREPSAAAPPQTPSADKPSLVFDGFKARGTAKGVKQWEAEAKRAWVLKGSRNASAEDVTITYFQKGLAVSRARALHAEINLKTYDLEAEGEVVVHGQNGVVLESDRLSWDNQTEQVHTRSKVRVLRGRSILTGKGLIADRKMEKVEVLEDVRVETASVAELKRMSHELK